MLIRCEQFSPIIVHPSFLPLFLPSIHQLACVPALLFHTHVNYYCYVMLLKLDAKMLKKHRSHRHGSCMDIEECLSLGNQLEHTFILEVERFERDLTRIFRSNTPICINFHYSTIKYKHIFNTINLK